MYFYLPVRLLHTLITLNSFLTLYISCKNLVIPQLQEALKNNDQLYEVLIKVFTPSPTTMNRFKVILVSLNLPIKYIHMED